jgi:hypothetical protein
MVCRNENSTAIGATLPFSRNVLWTRVFVLSKALVAFVTLSWEND